jgi:hypothetical protein
LKYDQTDCRFRSARTVSIALIASDASEPVRKCELKGMNPSKEDNVNPADKRDRAEDEEPQLVPPDLEIDEGDEKKNKGTDLPPAMPPMI